MKNSPYLDRPLRPMNKVVRAIIVKRRSPSAQALFNTNLPFKPQTVRSAKLYTRKVKHPQPLD